MDGPGDAETTQSEPSPEESVCGPPDPEAKVDLRQIPTMARHGWRIVWAASPRELLLVLGLQVVNGLLVAALLVLGQRALTTLFDTLGDGGDLGTIAPWAVLIGGLVAVQMFLNAVQGERQTVLGEEVVRKIQDDVLDVTTAVDLATFDEPAFHNRVKRVQESSHRPLDVVWGLSGLAEGAIGAVGVLVAFIAIEPLLIPLVAVVVIPVWLAASRRSELFWRVFWKLTPRDRERTYLFSLLTSRDPAKEVRAFGTAGHLRARYERLFDERLVELRKAAGRSQRYALLSGTGIGLVLCALLITVAWLAVDGQVSLASAGIAVAGVGVFGSRLARAGNAAGSLSHGALYLDDYRALMATRPIPVAEPGRPMLSPFGRIEADGITFTYPTGTHPALIDVSMHVDAGEVVALVGENGSGKTTLAKLLADLYTPQQGSVRWDGIDIDRLDSAELRRHVAVIFQDFLRYTLPARENIGLGRPDAVEDDEAIEKAGRQAGAHDFIVRLPHGYRTRLGPEYEDGVDLSVGQWQRLALARAFFRDAPFVILDEPTAALDARAEHDLFERIRTLLTGRTVLLISHRFSSVRSADRIYVLHQGRIIEAGTHEGLMSDGGVYAELFSLQAAAYLDGRTPAV
jgi:ATP-binding cassette subfamily B protein